MNDPHVVELLYNIEHDQSVDYSDAQPIEHEDENFSIKVENKQVRFSMKAHYATEPAARDALAPYIRAWEIEAALRSRPNRFSLKFEKAKFEDRKPTPDVVLLANIPSVESRVPPAVLTVSSPYPCPPSGIAISPDVESMFTRFVGYCEDREPLAAMAYFCLTVLEASLDSDRSDHHRRRQSKTRESAAKKYEIPLQELNELGTLTSKKGGSEARKAVGKDKEFTPWERRSVEETVKKIIRRLAEAAAKPNPPAGARR